MLWPSAWEGRDHGILPVYALLAGEIGEVICITLSVCFQDVLYVLVYDQVPDVVVLVLALWAASRCRTRVLLWAVGSCGSQDLIQEIGINYQSIIALLMSMVRVYPIDYHWSM